MSARARAARFCERYNLTLPILEAPMAGANSIDRATAIANAGGMGGFGALLWNDEQIRDWASQFRARSNRSFQINLWVPEPAPIRNEAAEAATRRFLSQWAPENSAEVWAGQAAWLARAEPADVIVRRVWDEAQALLP